MPTSAEEARKFPTIDMQPVAFIAHYRRWNVQHAGMVILLVAVSELPISFFPATALLAVWVALSMFRLWRLRALSPVGSPWADALTTVRTVATVLLLSGLSMTPTGAVHGFFSSGGRWVVVGALLAVESTDFFDGRVARRGLIGLFGPVWDMETDSVFALALAMANRHLLEVGPFVLAIGLMRFLYVLFWREEGSQAPKPHIFVLYAKTTTAMLVVVMIFVLAPPVGPYLRRAALLIVLMLQIISFGWDMYLQRRYGPEPR